MLPLHWDRAQDQATEAKAAEARSSPSPDNFKANAANFGLQATAKD